MQQRKKAPWRWVTGILAIACIVWMWAKKDLLSVWADLPAEQALPMLVTGVVVTLLKVALLAGIVLLLKWIAGKLHRE